MSDARDYSHGDWHVRAGSEDDFVARWTEFLEWTRESAPGLRAARLVQEAGDPSHFSSFAEWDSAASISSWMELADFAAKYGACAALCSEARGSRYTLAAHVP